MITEIGWIQKYLDINLYPRCRFIGTVSLDVENVLSESKLGTIQTNVTTITEGTEPDNYGFDHVYADKSTCGSILHGPSSLQLLTLSGISNGLNITEGSFKLSLDTEYTPCIPFNASSEEIETALQSLSDVDSVQKD